MPSDCFYKFKNKEQMFQVGQLTPNNLQTKTKQKTYQKVNGCTNTIPFLQAMAIVVMIAIEVLSFNLINSMRQLNSSILFALLAINYVFAVLMVIDYFILLLGDPSDPRLSNPNYSEPNQILIQCKQCQASVSDKSYHCKTCNRCVDQFDHHCVFLNNCIGKQNYSTFFKFLLILLCHMSLNIGIGIAMMIQLEDGYRWVALSFAILSFAVFVQIAVLAVFHCYISFVLYKSTLQVLKGAKKKSTHVKKFHIRQSSQPQGTAMPKISDNIVVQETTEIALQKAQNSI